MRKIFYYSWTLHQLRPNNNFHYPSNLGFYAYLKDRIEQMELELVNEYTSLTGKHEVWRNSEIEFYSHPFGTEYEWTKKQNEK